MNTHATQATPAAAGTPRHFLNLTNCSTQELHGILERASQLKAAWRRGERSPSLPGRVLVLLFEQPSTRTRASFEIGIAQLGGHAVFLNAADTQLRRGEPVEDTARVLSSMADAIALRTARHETQTRFAAVSSAPVINALSDRSHPCQLLADVMTFIERRGSIQGKVVTWLGDSNNVCHSWMDAARQLDFTLRIGCPREYEPDAAALAAGDGHVSVTNDPDEAVRGAHLLVTDVWASMGQESERELRRQRLAPYQLNADKRAAAAADALCMHCLPAHRGEEISAELLDAPDSAIWDEAENRLHTQKALLEFLLRH